MRGSFLLAVMIFAVGIVFGQIPNNPIDPPTDSYTIDIYHNGVYWTDSVKFSNGAVVRYSYDTLGNRSSVVDIPPPPLAELRVVGEQIPDTLGLGADANFSVSWRNSGPILANNFQLRPFLSVDSVYLGSPSDIPLDPTPYNTGLSPFLTEEVLTRIHIPDTISPNQYYSLFLHIDNDSLIQEYSDSNNVYLKKVFIVPCPAAPNLNESIAPEVCDVNNGRILVSIPMDHSIKWFNNSTDSTVRGLNGNSYYTYTLINSTNSCSYTDSFFVDDFPSLQVQTDFQNTTCNLSNGIAWVTPTSGYPPYTYAWDNGNTGSVLNNLGPGLQTVIVTDSTGCQDIFNIQVGATPLPNASIQGQNATCGEDNGLVTVTVSGGIPPYTYNWSNGDTSQLADSLEAYEIHSVLVADSTGCETSDQIQLINVGGIAASIVRAGNVLQANAVGTPPFNYMWNNGLVTQSISITSSGTYFVFVTDANNCVDSVGIQVVLDTAVVNPPTGIEDLQGDRNFYVYPNPNDGQSIMVHTTILDVQQLVVFDATGKVVAEQEVQIGAGQEIELRASLSSGVYVLVAKNSEGRQLVATQFVVR